MRFARFFILVLLLALLAARCTGEFPLWWDPTTMKTVDGHLLGDHLGEVMPSDGCSENSTYNKDNTTYSISALPELHRLFGAGPRGNDVPANRLIDKAILACPLMGRDNKMQLLLRPESDLFTGLAEKFGTRSLRKIPRIETGPDAIALDPHVHTSYSWDSLADVSQTLLAAYHRGLSGIAIADHDTTAGVNAALKEARRLIRKNKLPANFFVIPGEEVGSANGHIVALFVTKDIPTGMSAEQTVAAIHEQGGLAIAAHPMLHGGLGQLANTVPFDGVETKNRAEILNFKSASVEAKKRRDAFYATVTKPQIGSSDCHNVWGVGSCYTVLHCAPTPDAVKAAILAGDTTAVSDMPEETPVSASTTTRSPRGLSLFASAGRLERGFYRITRVSEANVEAWPHRSVFLQWLGRF